MTPDAKTETSAIRFRLPLSIVLGLQVVVVTAAFVAVIVVLSVQQKKEFQDSLYTQLSLRQSDSLAAVSAPVLRRIHTFETGVTHYVNGKDNSKIFKAPSDEPETHNLSYALDFYNHFYIYPRQDSGVILILYGNTSNLYSRPLGPSSTPERPVSMITRRWNTWAVDNTKLAVIQNDMGYGCLGTYPIPSIADGCWAVIGPVPYDTVEQGWGSTVTFTAHNRFFGGAALIADPTSPTGESHSMTYRIVIPQKAPLANALNVTEEYRHNFLIFGMAMAIGHIRPLLKQYLTLPSSRSALFTDEQRLDYGTHQYHHIASANEIYTNFNEAILNKTRDSIMATWRGGATPDPVLNAVFRRCEHMFANTTSSAAFELTVDGSDYVASAGRLYVPEYGMNWLLIEYTPREDFFGASDKARNIGIAIGVIGAIIVLIACALAWVAIQQPLLRMRAAMGLAADMKNDEVDEMMMSRGVPLLSEIAALHNGLLQMNAKLLAARPFLPQSLLRASNTSDDDDEEDGGFRMMDTEDEEEDAHSERKQFNFAGKRATSSRSFTVASGNVSRAETNNSSNKKNGGEGGARGKPIAALRREMMFRRVAILSINVVSFHDAVGVAAGGNGQLAASSATHLARYHTALARLIEVTISEERGIVDYFHGDRFVCGFNTARMSGNAARNGAEAAAKIWDRFVSGNNAATRGGLGLPPLPAAAAATTTTTTTTTTVAAGFDASSSTSHRSASRSQIAVAGGGGGGRGSSSATFVRSSTMASHSGSEHHTSTIAATSLLKAYPLGLAMGLGVGRAAVGNHGTDTMQRLATIGGPYTEAMRLQEVMSRRALFVQPHQQQAAAAAAANDTAGSPMTTANRKPAPSSSLPLAAAAVNPLLGGRCLVMGRVMQELETSKVYCQFIGGVDARELLGAVAAHTPSIVESFAMAKSRGAMKANNTAAVREDGPPNSTSAADRSAVLVGIVVLSESCANAAGHSTNGQPISIGGAAGAKQDSINDHEWLYELNAQQRANPFLNTNKAIYRLWTDANAPVGRNAAENEYHIAPSPHLPNPTLLPPIPDQFGASCDEIKGFADVLTTTNDPSAVVQNDTFNSHKSPSTTASMDGRDQDDSDVPHPLGERSASSSMIRTIDHRYVVGAATQASQLLPVVVVDGGSRNNNNGSAREANNNNTTTRTPKSEGPFISEAAATAAARLPMGIRLAKFEAHIADCISASNSAAEARRLLTFS